MKILNDKEHALLLSQSDAFMAIRTALAESSEGIALEEITSETIIEALQATVGESADAELQTQLTEAQTQLATAQTSLDTANARITELAAELKEVDEIPATSSATISPSGDASGKTETIAEFANKNKGDTEAILAVAVKEGLI